MRTAHRIFELEFEKCAFEKYEKLRTAVGIIFAGIPVNPNFWTALAMLCAIAGFVALAHANFQIGLFALMLSVIFDVIDGGVARVRKGETPFGAWLDDVSDRSRELLLLLGLFVAPINWTCPILSITKEFLIAIIIALTMLIDFAKMHACYRKILKESDLEFAPIEKIERFAILLIGLAAYNFVEIALKYAISAVLLMSIFRVIQILYVVLRESKKLERIKKIREVSA